MSQAGQIPRRGTSGRTTPLSAGWNRRDDDLRSMGPLLPWHLRFRLCGSNCRDFSQVALHRRDDRAICNRTTAIARFR